MKKITFIILLFLMSYTGYSQDNYVRVAGVRAGNPIGLTYKEFIGRYSALEGIVGVSFSYSDPRKKKLGALVTGLYEYHIPLGERLNLYGGAGVSIGGGQNLFILNADVILGLGYTIINFPLNLSIDYKPFYSPLNRKEIGIKGFGLKEFAVSVRYVIE